MNTTLCKEARAAREPVVFDHASLDPQYAHHPTPRLYNIESDISVPIVRPDGAYFGNLCAIDPSPNRVSDAKTIAMFQSFAELIGRQLDVEGRRDAGRDVHPPRRAPGSPRRCPSRHHGSR